MNDQSINERDEWRTPPEIVQQVARIYGGIAIDVACRIDAHGISNAVLMGGVTGDSAEPRNCPSDWSGLEIDWRYPQAIGHGAVWCNPPYSKIAPWVEKAIREFARADCPPIVMLLPANTDTRWFHRLANHPCVRVEFIPGRIRFLRPDGTPGTNPRTGSILAHFVRGVVP